ncbi:hypothetical protein KAW38_02190 [Candidatus Micrarchaeota archaeon]|nr:hypothetical protein [Candidatus Micrarchaeota archaeon]
MGNIIQSIKPFLFGIIAILIGYLMMYSWQQTYSNADTLVLAGVFAVGAIFSYIAFHFMGKT